MKTIKENKQKMTIEERIDILEEKIDEILSLARQHFEPMTNLEIKEIARQMALGNDQPLKDWNRRKKEEYARQRNRA